MNIDKNAEKHHGSSGEYSKDHDEISRVARELWRSRPAGVSGSAEDDWYRAEEIVRRRKASGPVAGNSPAQGESYVGKTSAIRANSDFQNKEGVQTMDNTTMTGSTQSAGSGAGSSSFSGGGAGNLSERVSDKVNETMGQLRDAAGNLIQRDPVKEPQREHREGPVARALEQQTAKLPSDVWLWAAFGSIGLSLAFELSGREKTANFIGHWAPTLLIIGMYNKMVKLQGSDGA